MIKKKQVRGQQMSLKVVKINSLGLLPWSYAELTIYELGVCDTIALGDSVLKVLHLREEK